MSQRLTNRRLITSLTDDPSMRGLLAYRAGRRQLRDAGGHGAGGGTGDAGGDDTDPADNNSGGDDDADEEDESDDDKDVKDKKEEKDDDEEPTVPQWKYDKLHNRMKAADQNASSLQKQLNDLKASADVPAEVKKELDEVRAKVSTVEAERDKMADAVKGLSIKLASLTMKGVPSWVDAETALKLADLSDVDISDDGKVDVKALKAALNTLAKEKPYLVAKTDGKGEGNDTGTGSASKMNGGRKGSKNQPDKATLAKRFPVLGR